MIQKPLTVARRDFVQDLVNLVNRTELPTFIKLEVMERILDEMRPLIDTELKRDEATWRAAIQAESEKTEEAKKGELNNGGQENQ